MQHRLRLRSLPIQDTATRTGLTAVFFRLKNLTAELRIGDRCRVRRGPALGMLGALCALLAVPLFPAVAGEQRAGVVGSIRLVGDGIPDPLSAIRGNAERGRALLVERAAANCLLCHAVPDPSMRVAGNVAPSLEGIGRRLSVAQLRLRVADIQRVNPNIAMPSYYRVEGLDRVAAECRGKPILDASQIEDIVAYLETLK